MLKSATIALLSLLPLGNTFAQFTKAENPSANFYLGYLGVVESKDTLFTTTAILSGFNDDGMKVYFSVDEGSTWEELVPNSGLTNTAIETDSPAGLYGSDTFLALAQRRIVSFSYDAGKTWTNQTSLASTNDENRGRFFAEIDNVVLAGTADDTNDGGTGIYRKEGDGSWELITQGLDANEANGAPNVVQLETDATRVYLSASDGFYVSDDKGVTYTRTNVNSIKNKFARRGDTILAAGTGGGRFDFGFWKSTNRGDSFTETIVTNVLESGVIYKPGITAMAADDEYFYVGLNTNTTFNGGFDGGVWKSANGETWELVGLKGLNISSLFVSVNRLFASVGGVYNENNGLYYIDKSEFATSVESDKEIVQGFELKQNFPNPFNPTTRIQFTLNQQSDVNLSVYTVLGQKVATLVNGAMPSGLHAVQFDASRLSSGVYIYTISTPNGSVSKRMSLIK